MAFLPLHWKTYISFGDLEVRLNENGKHLGIVSQVPHEYVDWVCGGMRGFVAGAIEVAGGKNGTATISSRELQGAGSEMYRISYEGRYQ